MIQKLLAAKTSLNPFYDSIPNRKIEAEGGCGVIGLLRRKNDRRKAFVACVMQQMRDEAMEKVEELLL